MVLLRNGEGVRVRAGAGDVARLGPPDTEGEGEAEAEEARAASAAAAALYCACSASTASRLCCCSADSARICGRAEGVRVRIGKVRS